MLDIETLKFLNVVNDLTDKTKKEAIPFSEIEYHDECYFYNNEKIDCEEHIIYDDYEEYTDDDLDNIRMYPIVYIMCVDDDHHDVVAYYQDTEILAPYDVCYVFDDTIENDSGSVYIDVSNDDYFDDYEDEEDCKTIIIDKGKWFYR